MSFVVCVQRATATVSLRDCVGVRRSSAKASGLKEALALFEKDGSIVEMMSNTRIIIFFKSRKDEEGFILSSDRSFDQHPKKNLVRPIPEINWEKIVEC